MIAIPKNSCLIGLNFVRAKEKLLPTDPRRGSSRSLFRRSSRAPCSLARRAFGSQHASGRSPDLVSQRRLDQQSLSCRWQPSRFEISGRVAGGFEDITVAGPRGNLTRFPILPDRWGTRSNNDDSKKSRLRICKLSSRCGGVKLTWGGYVGE
jgi:hypothetical protein